MALNTGILSAFKALSKFSQRRSLARSRILESVSRDSRGGMVVTRSLSDQVVRHWACIIDAVVNGCPQWNSESEG